MRGGPEPRPAWSPAGRCDLPLHDRATRARRESGPGCEGDRSVAWEGFAPAFRLHGCVGYRTSADFRDREGLCHPLTM
jgi:hypothetical protein